MQSAIFEMNHNIGLDLLNDDKGEMSQKGCLGDGYDDFMGELQARMKIARKHWTVKMDEFTQRLHLTHNANNLLHYIQQNRTFRVILQLFAYEDVLSNGKLDACFDVDQGEGIAFYVPQLLSFLLHGAFLNSVDLENWVLDKCQKNLHFAHCCYWFLRGWCLGGGEHCDGDRRLDRRISDSNLYGMRNGGPNRGRSNSFGDSDNFTEAMGRGNKYPAEERQIIEALLVRVVDSGQIATQSVVQSANSSQMKLETSQYVDLKSPPLSPRQTISKQRNDLQMPCLPPIPSLEMNTADTEPSIPNLKRILPPAASLSPLLLPQTNHTPLCAGDFYSTPNFLNHLIKIADDLFFKPREIRTLTLRNQLRQLESFLHDNVIYVPIQNVNHRVCRIIADESIAISTKERVPCIVCLEVIDHAPSRKQSSRVLEKWVKTPRYCQRHEGILEKVQHYTKEGLKKLREHEGDLREIWDKMYEDETDDTAGKGHEEHSQTEHLITDQASNVSSDNYESSEKSDQKCPPTPVSPKPKLKCPQNIDCPKTPPQTPESSTQASEDITLGQWSATPINNTTLIQRNNAAPKSASTAAASVLSPTPISPPLTLQTASLNDKHQPPNNSNTDNTKKAPLPQLPSPLIDQSPCYGTTTNPITEPPQEATEPPRPPPVVFKESWSSKTARIRAQSPHGAHPSYRLLPILIKTNDDLRQEQLASQLIQQMATIVAKARVPIWMYPYQILALTDSAGIIEAIPDTISLDSLKKNDKTFTTLPEFFKTHFGPVQSDSFSDAKANFVESLAAYSIVTYLLQIKDRHNGNILLDNKGHLIHIDFGFFFLSSPGKNSGFESAPFKLTREFVEIMDGPTSRTFAKFRTLCLRTFLELRKHCFQITLLVEMLMQGNEDLPCFCGKPEEAVRGLKNRFKLEWSDRACVEYVNYLIDESLENWRTRWYDTYQRFCVGVL